MEPGDEASGLPLSYRMSQTYLLITGGLVNVYIHSEELTDVKYVTDRVRVRVKAIGSLTLDDARTAARPHVATTPTPIEIKTDIMEMKGTEVSTQLIFVCMASIDRLLSP